MKSNKAYKLNNKYAKTCAAMPKDVSDKLKELSLEQQSELLANNTRLIENSYHQEVLTILLVVENDKLVSKVNAPIEEQVSIADLQTNLRLENLKKVESVRDFERAKKLALEASKQDIIRQGKTPVVLFGKLHVFNMDYKEYMLCKSAAHNCLSMLIAIMLNNIGILPFNSLLGRFNATIVIINTFITLIQMLHIIVRYAAWWLDNH